ncbi:MAG: helix-turn-helix domain-containing protein [Synergistaceae bacterium]|jgi:transcriptional regulator with XRE-family HTH domain|nr:helix-turn-helix domain-containing protein [Synergistaceae bacterium]
MNGARVRKKRKAFRWNQQELAQKAGVSFHTVFRAEQGRNIRGKNLRALAAALDTSIAYLMGEEDEPEESADARRAFPAASLLRERIAERRKKAGLTQKTLADLLKVPAATVTHIENGRCDPKTGTLSQIAAALDISVAYLMGEEADTRRAFPAARLLRERIAERRKKAGLTQEGLSELVKISASTINRIEKGHSDPRIKELSKIAAALYTSVAYLMGEKDRPGSTDRVV